MNINNINQIIYQLRKYILDYFLRNLLKIKLYFKNLLPYILRYILSVDNINVTSDLRENIANSFSSSEKDRSKKT